MRASVCVYEIGRILWPDQEHKEVISAPEGRSAGSRVGASSLPADGSAEEWRGLLRGRGQTPQASGQTLRSGTQPAKSDRPRNLSDRLNGVLC